MSHSQISDHGQVCFAGDTENGACDTKDACNTKEMLRIPVVGLPMPVFATVKFKKPGVGVIIVSQQMLIEKGERHGICII